MPNAKNVGVPFIGNSDSVYEGNILDRDKKLPAINQSFKPGFQNFYNFFKFEQSLSPLHKRILFVSFR